jgi:hypothetical protein
LGVGIGGIDGIGVIKEGVLIGWRNVRISRISGVSGIGEIRKRDIDDVGIGGIDGNCGIREGVPIGWRYVGISRINGVDVIGEIRKRYIDDVGIGDIDGIGIVNRDVCGASSSSCIGTSLFSCICN